MRIKGFVEMDNIIHLKNAMTVTQMIGMDVRGAKFNQGIYLELLKIYL